MRALDPKSEPTDGYRWCENHEAYVPEELFEERPDKDRFGEPLPEDWCGLCARIYIQGEEEGLRMVGEDLPRLAKVMANWLRSFGEWDSLPDGLTYADPTPGQMLVWLLRVSTSSESIRFVRSWEPDSIDTVLFDITVEVTQA